MAVRIRLVANSFDLGTMAIDGEVAPRQKVSTTVQRVIFVGGKFRE